MSWSRPAFLRKFGWLGPALVLCFAAPAIADSEASYLSALFDPGFSGFAFAADGTPILAAPEWKSSDIGTDGKEMAYTTRAQVIPGVPSPKHALLIRFWDVGRKPRMVAYHSLVAPGTKFYASFADTGRLEFVTFLYPKVDKVDMINLAPDSCVQLASSLKVKSVEELLERASQCQGGFDAMLPVAALSDAKTAAREDATTKEIRARMDQLSFIVDNSRFAQAKEAVWLPGRKLGYDLLAWARLCVAVPSFAAKVGASPVKFSPKPEIVLPEEWEIPIAKKKAPTPAPSAAPSPPAKEEDAEEKVAAEPSADVEIASEEPTDEATADGEKATASPKAAASSPKPSPSGKPAPELAKNPSAASKPSAKPAKIKPRKKKKKP